MKQRATCLTIAGSDCSGGAGIQADLKTMLANGVYGMSAITALTAQNTTGVSGIFPVSGEFLRKQLDAVFTDIWPDAVKIGMVSSTELICVIGQKLTEYQAKKIVLDPVMVATSGASLLEPEAVEAMTGVLFPLADLITPNIPESEFLTGMQIRTPQDMEEAAKTLSNRYDCQVLCKGGHRIQDANDYLYDGSQGVWLKGQRIRNENTHGTGCTLSSAIAAGLAKGQTVREAVENAKDYISEALRAGLDLGKGSGPLDHGYRIP